MTPEISSKLQEKLREAIADPVKFYFLFWPKGRLYDKQVEILYSVRDNPETFVHAGNKLGKDYISSVVVLWFFLSREPARVITSSSTQDQLSKVLWSEIKQRIDTAAVPMPIKFNFLHISKHRADGSLAPMSYLVGHVTNSVESFQGHHLPKDRPRVLFLGDEASGISDEFYDAADSWAHRKLIIGNPLNNSNFFYKYCKKGKSFDEHGNLYRNVIHIGAEHSPNVRKAIRMKEEGHPGPYPTLVPGVVDYADAQNRVREWDIIKLHTRHHGLFYEGEEVLLYTPAMLDEAERVYLEISLKQENRQAKSMGVDCGEGGDETCWTIIDEYGIMKQVEMKTPETNIIPARTIAYINEYKIPPDRVMFDAGGGGRPHADRCRELGYKVSTVHFGEAPTPPIKHTRSEVQIGVDNRRMFKNKRVEMYWNLRVQLQGGLFGLPPQLTKLRQELAPTPLLYDSEGTMFLPPKSHPNPNYRGDTIIQLIGWSPNRADSLVLAVEGMMKRKAVKYISMS